MNREEIIALRKSKNLTQEKFAHLLGCTHATVNKWENGHSSPSRLYIQELHNIDFEKEEPNE